MKLLKEHLVAFHNQMIGFDTSELILVMYDDLSNTFSYYQGNKLVIAPWLNYMYLPCKFRYGLLTPAGYQELMTSIDKLIKSQAIDEPTLMSIIDEGKVSFYYVPRAIGKFSPGPQKVTDIKFYTWSSRFMRWFILHTFGGNSKLLRKRIKYDKMERNRMTYEEVIDNTPMNTESLNNRE